MRAGMNNIGLDMSTEKESCKSTELRRWIVTEITRKPS